MHVTVAFIVLTSQSISLTTRDGLVLSGPGTIAQAMVAASEIPQSAQMLGDGPAEQARVASWLAASAKACDDGSDLDSLDRALKASSYVAGGRLTAADILTLHAAHSKIAAEAPGSLQKRPSLLRWVDQLQHELPAVFAGVPGAAGVLALHCPPLPVPQVGGAKEAAELVAAAIAAPRAAAGAGAVGAGAPVAAAAAAAPAAGAGASSGAGSGADGSAAAAAAGGAGAGADDVAAARAAKKAEKEAKKKARAAQKAANEAKLGKGGKGKGKGGGGGGGTAAGGAADGAPITRADIRVGLVVKAYPHPEREKLVCEEIDVGEAEPRTIASGVSAFYKPEEVQGRKVVVLCNLPPRKMGDEFAFKSNGMVLCASDPDHKNVKFVEVPEGAKPGERVSFPGHEGEPLAPKPFAKKKWLEKILPGFKVDGSLQATWDGVPFTTSAGPCFIKDESLKGGVIG